MAVRCAQADRAAWSCGNPGGHFRSGPQPTFGGLLMLNGVKQRYFQLGAQSSGLSVPRASVGDGSRPNRVVSPDRPYHPIGLVLQVLRYLLRASPFRLQCERLSPTPSSVV